MKVLLFKITSFSLMCLFFISCEKESPVNYCDEYAFEFLFSESKVGMLTTESYAINKQDYYAEVTFHNDNTFDLYYERDCNEMNNSFYCSSSSSELNKFKLSMYGTWTFYQELSQWSYSICPDFAYTCSPSKKIQVDFSFLKGTCVLNILDSSEFSFVGEAGDGWYFVSCEENRPPSLYITFPSEKEIISIGNLRGQ